MNEIRPTQDELIHGLKLAVKTKPIESVRIQFGFEANCTVIRLRPTEVYFEVGALYVVCKTDGYEHVSEIEPKHIFSWRLNSNANSLSIKMKPEIG